MTETSIQLTPARVVSALVRGWWIIVATAVIGGAGAFAYSSTQTPVYQSTSATYFSMRSGTSGSDINQGSAYTQNQMLSFAQLAMSTLVIEPVRETIAPHLTLQQIRNLSSVTIPQNTVILEITASSSDPQFAADLANGLADNLASVVAEIAPTDEAGAATIVARVVQPAIPATVQSSPNKQRDAVLGGMGGLLFGALGLVLWALLDTRVRSEDVLRRVTPLPLLGMIPTQKQAGRVPIVSVQPNGISAEAYRGVRSSLRFAAVEHEISAIAVTSSIPGEGKTTTAVNLALAYAETGRRVLLVDADLRRPMVAESLGLENAVGLTTMLVGAANFDTARLVWGESSLWVLPAGEVPPNPAELLASARMSELLLELRAQVDVMIVDTAPLLSVADATIIAQVVDTTIMVVDVKRTRMQQLGRAVAALTAVRANVAGIVFTRVRARRRDSYYYSSAPVPSAPRHAERREGPSRRSRIGQR